MQWLAALCVKRPVFATVLILSLVVIGGYSFTKLGVDRFPKIDFPTVLITTVQPGAAPEQIETEITDKIEEAVNTISGIDELRSVSSEGISQVIIAFLLDKNTDVAAQEVRDKVNGVLPQLPKTIQQPRVDRFDPDAAPVLSLALSANQPVRDITEYADKVLRRQIESVNGVGQVLVLGGRQRQINVWLDADRLRGYNLTVNDVARALQSQNIEIPGGRVDQGPQSVTLRTRGRVQTVAEFNDIVVREKDGHPVRISEVARVEDGEAEPETIANLNGAGTVLLQVRRQSGTNTVEVVNEVKRRLEDVRAALPAGYDLRLVRDTSEFIEAAIHNVEEHLIVGSDPGRPGRAAVPEQPALHDHRGDRDPDLDHRHLRPDLVHGLHAQPDDDARADAIGRHRDRRRDRRAREHLPVHRGEARRSVSRRGRGHAGDRPRGAGDHALAGGDLRAGRLHGRHRRHVHEELRPDDGVRDHGVAARELHADADALGAVAEGQDATARTSTARKTPRCSPRSTASTRGCSSGRWSTAGSSPSSRCWCCSPACRCS